MNPVSSNNFAKLEEMQILREGRPGSGSEGLVRIRCATTDDLKNVMYRSGLNEWCVFDKVYDETVGKGLAISEGATLVHVRVGLGHYNQGKTAYDIVQFFKDKMMLPHCGDCKRLQEMQIIREGRLGSGSEGVVRIRCATNIDLQNIIYRSALNQWCVFDKVYDEKAKKELAVNEGGTLAHIRIGYNNREKTAYDIVEFFKERMMQPIQEEETKKKHAEEQLSLAHLPENFAICLIS